MIKFYKFDQRRLNVDQIWSTSISVDQWRSQHRRYGSREGSRRNRFHHWSSLIERGVSFCGKIGWKTPFSKSTLLSVDQCFISVSSKSENLTFDAYLIIAMIKFDQRHRWLTADSVLISIRFVLIYIGETSSMLHQRLSALIITDQRWLILAFFNNCVLMWA